MGKVKIPYYVVKLSGRAYWRPTRSMRERGFHLVPLGRDGPDAWASAEKWNRKWQAVREVMPRRCSTYPGSQAMKRKRHVGIQPAPSVLLSSDTFTPANGRAARSRPATRFGGRHGSGSVTCSAMSPLIRSTFDMISSGVTHLRKSMVVTWRTKRSRVWRHSGKSCSP